MAFVEWRETFDDLFEVCQDRWKLTLIHRSNLNQIRKLQSKNSMPWTTYAR